MFAFFLVLFWIKSFYLPCLYKPQPLKQSHVRCCSSASFAYLARWNESVPSIVSFFPDSRVLYDHTPSSDPVARSFRSPRRSLFKTNQTNQIMQKKTHICSLEQLFDWSSTPGGRMWTRCKESECKTKEHTLKRVLESFHICSYFAWLFFSLTHTPRTPTK